MDSSRPQIFQSAAVIIVLVAAAASPFFFVGFEFSATKTALLSVLAAIGVFLLTLSVQPRAREFQVSSACLPLVGFLALAGLSSLGAVSRTAALTELVNLAPFLALFFLVFFSFQSQDPGKLMLVLALPVAGISLIGILQFFEILPIGMDRYGAKDPASTLGLSNFAAEYLAAALLPLAAAGLARGKTLARIFLGSGFGIGFVYLLLTGNRAGWVGFLAGLFLMALFSLASSIGQEKNRFPRLPGGHPGLKYLLLPGFLTVLAVILILLTPGGRKIPDRFFSIFNLHDPAIRFRLLASGEALRMSRDHPFLGIGPGNFSVMEPLYQTREMVKLYQGANVDISRVHNEYLSALVELGIPAALLFFLFLGLLLNSTFRSLSQSSSREEFLSRLGILGGLSASLVVALFSFNLHNPASGFVFWVLAGTALKTGAAKTIRLSPPGREKFFYRARRALGAFFTLILIGISYQNIQMARAEVYFRDGLRRMVMEKAGPAEAFLSRAIAAYPWRPAYYYNRAMCRHYLKNTPDAVEDMKRYLDFHPHSARGHQALGVMLVELGREADALREIERATGLYPEPAPELFSLLLNLKLGVKEYDSVIQVGARALKLYPGSPEILLAVSQAYFYRGDLELAARGYQSVIETDPENVSARRYLGQTFIEMKKFRPAAEVLARAARQSPGSPDLWFHLARAQAGAGQTASARNSLKTAVGLDPRLRDLAARDILLSVIK